MHKIMTLAVVLILTATASGFAQNKEQLPTMFETTFDCKKASRFVEKAVCFSKRLAHQDVLLFETYQETIATNILIDPTQKSFLKSTQLAWLKALRTDCVPTKGETPQNLSKQSRDCIDQKYKQQIAKLQSLKFDTLDFKKISISSDKAVSQTCFQFNRAVEKSQKLPLRSYIDMVPQRDYSARIHGNELCILGLPHSQTTRITLRKGLKGSGDHYLVNDINRDVTISSRAQSISFTKGNYILPQTGTPYLPIKTINHSSIDLTFYQIDERNFIKALSSGLLGKQLRSWQENSIRDTIGAEVWSGSVEINNLKDQEITTQIPIKQMVEKFKPGIYVLVAKKDAKEVNYRQVYAAQWVVVTDLGLSVFKGEKGVSLQARSLKTAKPMKGVQIRLVAKNNMVLAEKVTNRDGWIDLSPALLNGKGGKEVLYLTAQNKQGDFSFISLNEPALDLSEHGVAGKTPPGPLQSFLYSDRGIYRPGETVKLGYLVRDDYSLAQADIPVTVILYRPDGKEAFKTVQSPDEQGGGRIDIPIINAAATGRWKIAAFSDPQSAPIGELNIQVEEFVPERLEVSATTNAEKLVFGETVKLDVQADYLFGAPGSGLKVKGVAQLEIDRKPFKEYAMFQFGLQEDKAKNLEQLNEVVSNDKGASVLEIPAFQEVDLSSPLQVKAHIEVADTDGRPSRTMVQIPLISHEAFIGLKPEFSGQALKYNQDALFEAISVDPDGNPIAQRELSVEWVREDRTYNWFYQAGEWRSTYNKYDIPLYQEILSSDKNGKITFSRSFDRWGYYRAIVTDVKSGAASDFTFRVGWWANAQSPDTPDELELSLKNDDIDAGNKIKGFVKAPFEGKALISVAQKNIIWKTEIFLPKKGKEFSIPVQKEWGNGAYVLVTAYRPGEDTDQRGPGRAVGAKWVSFGKQKRTLSVQFDLPKEVRPSTEVTVPFEVSGQALKTEKVKVNLFAVDEGILRLTQFKSPQPDKFLLAQQRLQLAYHDLYGRLIAPEKGELGRIRSGGDISNAGNQGGLSTRVFKAVTLVSQTIDVDSSGKGKVSFKIPDFNGKLRFFAVAYSKTATGGGEAHLLIRSPVIAELLPSRFLAPGDKASFALRFQNLNGAEGTYTVKLSTSGMLTVENPDWSTQSKPGEKAETRFNVVADKVGKAQLSLNVEGPNNFSQHREWDLDIRPAQPWVTTIRQMELANTESYTFDPSIFDYFLPGSGQLNLMLSAKPEIDVQKLVTALDRYPYGCLEQTTSRAFPLLAFSKVKEAWKDVEFNADSLNYKIIQGIHRVLAKQKTDGSFGLWSRQSHPEPWLTAYAMDFLTEARKQGFDVLSGPFDSGLDWMENIVKNVEYSADARSYMLLVLAKNDRFSTSNFKYEFNRLFADESGSALAQAQLIAASSLKGIDGAKRSVQNMSKRAKRQGDDYDSYGSSLRDYAAILALPKNVFASDNERLTLLSSLFEELDSRRYTSTQEKGWLLLAAAKIAENASDNIKVKINDAVIERETTYRSLLTPSLLTSPYRLENNQDAALFVQYSFTGIPSKPLKEEAEGLSVSRTILNMEGDPVSMDNVKTGDKFIVMLEGESSTNLKHKALIVDLLPAGFEIESNAFNIDLIEQLGMTVKDVSRTFFKAERDDRFVAAVDLTPKRDRYTYLNDAFRLGYVVRAVTPGEYVYPAPFVEDMYKPSYFARGALSRLIVQGQ
ncbi:MAG: hypothetical protein HWE30_07300 [Methylocystaceae bacterium]|nr:hypothetical protein [Methylocystaceae bacterium]